MENSIIYKLLPIKSLRRSGIKNLGVKFIVCHDTGNDGSTANGNVKYYHDSANKMQSSAHYFVDDKNIICVIPEDEKAWHIHYGSAVDNKIYGDDANDIALGIELCYSTKKLFDSIKAYQNYCALIAHLCIKYKLNHTTNLISHAKLDPTRRTDPINAFSKIGKTWEQFIIDVGAIISSNNKHMKKILRVLTANYDLETKQTVAHFVLDEVSETGEVKQVMFGSRVFEGSVTLKQAIEMIKSDSDKDIEVVTFVK